MVSKSLDYEKMIGFVVLHGYLRREKLQAETLEYYCMFEKRARDRARANAIHITVNLFRLLFHFIDLLNQFFVRNTPPNVQTEK